MSASTCAGSTPRSSPARRSCARVHDVNAVLVPGGFGERGVEGKIAAVTYARDQQAAVPRHLLRHAARLRRGGAQPRRHQRRQLDRVRPLRRPDRRPADRVGAGRRRRAPRGRTTIWAARCGWAPTPAWLEPGSLAAEIYGAHRHQRAAPAPLRGQRQLPAGSSSGPACASPACRRTAACPRSSSCRTIPGSSACSSTPS